MIDSARKVQVETGRTVENLVQYEIEQIKALCGPSYAHVPLDDIRRQASNLRKRRLLGSVKGHGPRKFEIPPEMQAYYQTDHWKEFRVRVLNFWNYRCALCNDPSGRDVHHRTYKRLYHEELNDCVLLCRRCHKHADNRRKAFVESHPSEEHQQELIP